MPRRNVSADRRHREALRPRPRSPAGAERQRGDRRQLDRGAGKHQRAQRDHFVCRLAAKRAKPARRHPADIAVAFELAPGPAFVVGLVDRHALAHERFGIEGGIR